MIGSSCTRANENFVYRAWRDRIGVYPVWDHSFLDANERALSIAIHQFHGHQIWLRDYRVADNEYSGVLEFRSYDHFGLDTDDEITEYGFVDWFTLQHYDRFDGRYSPPIAVVTIRVPFRGSF